MEKQAETTEPTTDRHGHDRPSRGSRFKTLRNSEKMGTEIDSLNFVTEWQDGPSWARRTVTHLPQKLTLNFVTEAAGRTVAGTTGRHRLRNPRLGRISVNILRGVLDDSGL